MNTLIEFVVMTWKTGREAGLSKAGHELMAGRVLAGSAHGTLAVSVAGRWSLAFNRVSFLKELLPKCPGHCIPVFPKGFEDIRLAHS